LTTQFIHQPTTKKQEWHLNTTRCRNGIKSRNGIVTYMPLSLSYARPQTGIVAP
jgi:hypothetical protein